MEVYRNEVEELRHYVVVAGQITTAPLVTARIYDPLGIEIFSGEADLIDDDPEVPYYSLIVGPDITSLGAGHTIEWSYTIQHLSQMIPVVRREELNVVTPYISMAALKTNPELEGIEDYALRKMERLVSGIIDVFANQTFSRDNNVSITILGQDSDQLPLPKRIIRLADISMLDHDEGITPYPLNEYVMFDPDDRWTLRRRTSHYVQRKFTPTTRYRFFKYPSIYRVTGDWGWEYVPEDVTHAAMILVQEYFCEDAKYRDKFISNIRAGDWRMEFKLTGDETTGSANADMLLTRYRNVGLAVI